MHTRIKKNMIIGSVAVAAFTMAATAENTDGWESQIAAGVNLTDGNSETTQGNVNLDSKNIQDKHETIAGAGYAYGETKRDGDDKTIDNGNAFGQYNYLYKDSSYVFARGEYSFDDIADVDYRIKLSPGMGYYLVQNDKHSIAAELWPAFVADKVGGKTDDAVVLRFAERGDHKISATAKIWHALEYLPEFEDFGTYLLSAEVGAESAMTERMSLRLVVQDKYDSEPAAGRDENDLTITGGVVYKL